MAGETGGGWRCQEGESGERNGGSGVGVKQETRKEEESKTKGRRKERKNTVPKCRFFFRGGRKKQGEAGGVERARAAKETEEERGGSGVVGDTRGRGETRNEEGRRAWGTILDTVNTHQAHVQPCQ